MLAWLAPSQDGSAVPLWASLLMVAMGLALTGLMAYQIARVQSGGRGGTGTRGAAVGTNGSVQADGAGRAAATGGGGAGGGAGGGGGGGCGGGANPAIARELNELCTRVADELDRRAERLEKLIAEADAKLARLERLTAGAVAPDPLAVLAESKPRAAAVPMHDGDPLAGEVYRLADSGLPPVQIAQKLGQHTGKVELILALRRA